jgi:hypothetical protein
MELASGLMQMPLGDKRYLYLVAANIAAVLMPFTVPT